VKAEEVSRFLRDANSFVASSRAAIEWSAPHIYLSALPFAPKDSLVFQDFSSFLSGVISVEMFGIDRHGGRLVMNLTGHEETVRSVVYSPDGRLLASGSADGTVRIWNTLTGEETMAPLQSGDGEVTCVAFAHDGQRVFSGTKGHNVHIWSARTGRTVMAPLRGHSESVWALALSPDGRLVASGSWDKSIRLWDATTGQAVAVLNGHTYGVLAVAFTSDGHTLASGAQDCTVRFWNVRTYEPQGEPLRGSDGWVTSIAFSPEDQFIAAGFDDSQEIRIWDVTTGTEFGAPLKAACAIQRLVFAHDGSYLASTGPHGIRFWDWKTGQDVVPALSGHTDFVSALSYSPDGLYIVSASEDHTIRIWDAEHSRTLIEQLPSHNGSVNSVAVSADGSFIVSGSADRTIRLWNSQTAEQILPPLIGHTDLVLCVAISADNQFIASGSVDHTVRLWNAKTGELIREPLEGHIDWVRAVTFSHDVRWLASASDDKTVGLWALAVNQAPTFRQLQCDYQLFSVAFSSDGQLLAVGDYYGYVILWELATDGGHIVSAKMRVNSSDIKSVCFSPDNSKIAAASDATNIYVWDVETKSLLQTLEGHQGAVRAVAYSADGEWLASGDNDYIVRLWDASTGEAVAVLHGHADTVRSVSFMPDGKSFVSGAQDGTIRLWSVDNVVASPSQANLPPANILARARQDDGWLVGSSGERLIWLPQEYRLNIVVGKEQKLLIASHRVLLSADPTLHHGTEWVKCWRGPKSSTASGSP